MTSGGFPRMTWEPGVIHVEALVPVTTRWHPDLHGDLDLLAGAQALRQVLQAIAAVGVGKGVAAPTAPGHRPVGVVGHLRHPAARTTWSLGTGVTARWLLHTHTPPPSLLALTPRPGAPSVPSYRL